MRLVTRGKPVNIADPVIGRITRDPLADRSTAILVTSAGTKLTGDAVAGYRGLINVERAGALNLCATVPAIDGVRDHDHLRDGDVVVLESSGTVRTLYRPDSSHNALFVTERCNCNCLMCPQPPKDQDDIEHFQCINEQLISLIDPKPAVMGITGGEPTLLRENLCTLLETLKSYLPSTHVQLLSNGRLFAWPEFTAQVAHVGHPDLLIAVSLYSDFAGLHDYIVQAKGAFDQTVLGMHQLARWRQPVEVRVVLHKLTVPRLVGLAEYIWRNLTFAVHVVFMGLETVGYARYHRDKLWIDPPDFHTQLEEAVEFLTIRGMTVSIYNLPHCFLPPSLRAYARRSISDWKNEHDAACASCGQRAACAGFFASVESAYISRIHPL